VYEISNFTKLKIWSSFSWLGARFIVPPSVVGMQALGRHTQGDISFDRMEQKDSNMVRQLSFYIVHNLVYM